MLSEKARNSEVRKNSKSGNSLASFLLKTLAVLYLGILHLPSRTRSKNTAAGCWFICAEQYFHTSGKSGLAE